MLALVIFATYFFPSGVQASQLFDQNTTLTVKKELKATGAAPSQPENVYSEMKMDFESFDLNDMSGRPIMASHTDQLVKMKKLPKDPAAAKDGLDDRLEMTYERMLTESSVTVPGMSKPFITKSDMGIFLMNKPIVIRGDGKTPKKVEGIERIRTQAQTEVADPNVRAALLAMFNQDILLGAGASLGHTSSCLGGFAGKKPGEKWGFSREEQGVKLDYECEFEGWAEVKEKKVAVIKILGKKQKQVRKQPNGVPAMAESEGSGFVYFEPSTQEALMKLVTKLSAEPMEEEIRQLKAQGAQIPRNRSEMKMWNHLYPIN